MDFNYNRRASSNLAPGSTLQVLKMKGAWWTEMKRGSKFRVQGVKPHARGTMVTLKGGPGSSAFSLLMPANQDPSGEFTLVDTEIRRGLLVESV